ncbi:hypothetical protein FRB99_003764 [Tulasnella sp. 403]|nr:hypothetical protein FRB99_003764 [Tulasnella sp. 403]
MIVIRDNSGKADQTKLQETINRVNSHDIELRVQAHEEHLQECVKLLEIATALQVHDKVNDIKDGQEQDRQRLDEILAEQKKMAEKMAELTKQLGKHERGSEERQQVESELREIRLEKFKGRQIILPAEITGECQPIGTRPVIQGAKSDIWKGLWLDETSQKGMPDYPSTGNFGLTDVYVTQRFERQIDIWRSLENDYVLPLFGWCEINNDIFLVSPWMKSGNVIAYLKLGRSDAQKLQIIRDILRGLQYLHSQNIVHGGLRPVNILIGNNGHAVLSDFSLAKPMGDDEAPAVNTQSNAETDDYRYQAPEIINGGAMEPASDVYSWSMTALEVLSQKKPFHHLKALRIPMAVVVSHEIPHIDKHPSTAFDAHPQLWGLLQKCWATEPEERPTVDALLTELEAMTS